MFGLILKMFIGLLTGLVIGSNPTISLLSICGEIK